MESQVNYPFYQNTPANCRNGPRYERGITDCLCCLLYILLCIAVVVLFAINYKKSVQGYDRPFDYDHGACFGAYKYLYIANSDTSKTTCVQSCPSEPGHPINCRLNSRFPTCPVSTPGLVTNQALHLCYTRGLDISRIIKSVSPLASMDGLVVGYKQILMTAGFIAAVGLLLVITTFIFPQLMTCLYMIIFQLLLAAISFGFFYRYFRGRLPFVDASIPEGYQNNTITLVLAIVFAVAFVVSMLVLCSKLSKIPLVVVVLKIARTCLCQNLYMILVSFLLTAISVIVLLVNLFLLYKAVSTGTTSASKHQPYNQFQFNLSNWWYIPLLGITYLWTHGLMIAISDFLFQGFATFYYFNQRSYGPNYSKCNNFTQTVKLLFYHFGTTCFGAILAYIPQSFSSAFNSFEYNQPAIYNTCCCCHKFCLRYLSKYCYIQTILQSYSFCDANQKLFYLRRRAKQQVPQLYMMGNFYQTAAKTFLVLLSVVVCYGLLIMNWPQYYQNVWSLLYPLIATAFIASQIANHFMNCTGLIGDTLVFMYCVDLQIQKQSYGSVEARSCPMVLRSLIKDSKLIVV